MHTMIVREWLRQQPGGLRQWLAKER
jgi:hypothetical protein